MAECKDYNDVLAQFRKEVRRCCSLTNRSAFSQEPNYVMSLIGALKLIDIWGDDGSHIVLSASGTDDRGPGAAENKYGADFALIFDGIGAEPVTKAVLGQGKPGPATSMTANERQRLDSQCLKMSRVTSEYLVLEAPWVDGEVPLVRLGTGGGAYAQKTIPLDDYLVDHLVACTHGDRDQNVIDRAMNSQLAKVFVKVEKPSPALRSKTKIK